MNNVKIFYYTSPLVDSLTTKKPSFYNNCLFTSIDEMIQKIRDTN